jgi:hypothetical protein
MSAHSPAKVILPPGIPLLDQGRESKVFSVYHALRHPYSCLYPQFLSPVSIPISIARLYASLYQSSLSHVTVPVSIPVCSGCPLCRVKVWMKLWRLHDDLDQYQSHQREIQTPGRTWAPTRLESPRVRESIDQGAEAGDANTNPGHSTNQRREKPNSPPSAYFGRRGALVNFDNRNRQNKQNQPIALCESHPSNFNTNCLFPECVQWAFS